MQIVKSGEVRIMSKRGMKESSIESNLLSSLCRAGTLLAHNLKSHPAPHSVQNSPQNGHTNHLSSASGIDLLHVESRRPLVMFIVSPPRWRRIIRLRWRPRSQFQHQRRLESIASAERLPMSTSRWSRRSEVRALQEVSRQYSTHIGYVEVLTKSFLFSTNLLCLPAPFSTSIRPGQVAGAEQCDIPSENMGG